MKKRHYDKDHLYDCPVCTDQALYVHEHKTVSCKNCEFRGVIKKNRKTHKKELHLTIDGVHYSVEPEEKEEDEKICVVVNNELVCVDKHSVD